MRAVFRAGNGGGLWRAYPSKSLSHRALFAAALSKGESTIKNLSACDDVLATEKALAALGAHFLSTADGLKVRGFFPAEIPENTVLDCKESGTTLRFLIPLALLSGKRCVSPERRAFWSGPYRFMKRSRGSGGFVLKKTGTPSPSAEN